MNAEILKDMVDYIEITDSAIRDLKDQPAFSSEALEKTAESLVDSDVIQSVERDELIDLFRQNPDKALESLTKLAERLPKASPNFSLGAPGEDPRPRSRFSKESDRVLYEKLGLL